jgi:AraC-like DNA-binding protein|tara:strand:+ start:265 stop:1224 length:960 start_codon:yes stop_codon:yes gene_type:complete
LRPKVVHESIHLNRGNDKLIAQNDISKSNFKKYLIVSELDKKWGFTVNDVGHTTYPEGSEYPSKGHPGTHMFSWETGRTLNEYHLVLISQGLGVFESKSAGKRNIHGGDAFLLFPDEWHRYKPLEKSGWTENWVGFSGEIANMMTKEIFLKKTNPIVSNFNNQLVTKLFQILHNLVEEEPFGFQRTASGICIQLIAEFCNLQLGSELIKESAISRAKYILNEKIDGKIDLKKLAENLELSYSKFRSDFKRQTGLSPLRYFLLLKIEKSKCMLLSTNLTSRQIAYELGFESECYFSRLFKNKTGMTPQQFRMENQRQQLS